MMSNRRLGLLHTSQSEDVVDTQYSFDDEGTLERADPELCIEIFRRELNFSGLQRRLREADRSWMSQFLLVNGLSALFEVLESLSQKKSRRGVVVFDDGTGSDAAGGAVVPAPDTSYQKSECVACVKAVMNYRRGMECMVSGDGFIRKLAQVLDENSNELKAQVLELLSALCLYSSEAYKLTMEALEDFKSLKQQRFWFSYLLQEFQHSTCEEYLAAIAAFVNCALAGIGDLAKRIKLRNELIAHRILDVLGQWRHSTNEDLATQIEVFHEEYASDKDSSEDALSGEYVLSLEDTVNAVVEKVRHTPQEQPFVNILNSLLHLMEQGDKRSADMWKIVEELCLYATGKKKKSTSEDNIPANDAIVEKLNAILKEEELPKENGIADDCKKESGEQGTGEEVTLENGGSMPEENLSTTVPTASAPGPPPPPPPPPPMGGMFAAPPPEKMTKIAKSRTYKPKRQMRVVPWNKLTKPDATVPGVLWEKAAQGEMDSKVDFDPVAVEDLFAKPEAQKKEVLKKDDEGKKKSQIFQLDQETERNATVTLRGLDMTNAAIAERIKDLDSSKMSIVQLKTLEQQLSKDTVKKQLLSRKKSAGEHTDSSSQGQCLNRVQDFFLKIAQVELPHVRAKLMWVQLEVNGELEMLKQPVATLEAALDELLTCDTLTEVFLVALTAGNIVNGGTYAGNAYGFKVGSLCKLKETRSKNAALTFLHYICEVCEDQSPELLQLSEELPHLKNANKVPFKDLQKGVEDIRKKIAKFEKEVKGERLDDHLKGQLDAFLEKSYSSLRESKALLDKISEMKNAVAVHFCEDTSEFKLEDLLKLLLTFVSDFTSAKKENDIRKQLEKKRSEARTKALEKARLKKQAAAMDLDDQEEGVDFGEPFMGEEEEEDDSDIIDSLLAEMKAGIFQRRKN